MKAFLFRILSIFLGLLTGAAVILLFEYLDHLMNPLPAGFDPSDPEAMKRLVASLPLSAFLLVLGGLVLGTFAGSWVAARLDRETGARAAIVVGSLFLLGAVLNFMAIPHPHWFVAVSLLSFLPATYLGLKLGRRHA